MTPLFQPERRICMVKYYDGEKMKERRAFFHLFTTRADVIPPSQYKGGSKGGPFSKPLAIVEYEDGTVDRVPPTYVRFLDTAGLMEQYSWSEDTERGCFNCKHGGKSHKDEPCDRCIGDGSKWEESENATI